jgi:hypothetical protein
LKFFHNLTRDDNDAPKGPQNPETSGQGPTKQAAAAGKPTRGIFMEQVKSFFAWWGQKLREMMKKLAFWTKSNPELKGTTS